MYMYVNFNCLLTTVASCDTGALNVTVNAISCGFDYQNEIFFKFIFSFVLSGNEAKRGVEFRHSTRNASRIWRKVGNGLF